MDTLRSADLRRALRFVGTMADAGADPELFARAGVSALPLLVASEVTTLSVCDLASGRRHVFTSLGGQLSAGDRACFDRFFRQHPLVRFHGADGGRGAHRISDSEPFTRFRQTALYAEYYRRIGIDHVVALPIRVDARILVSFVLNRKGRDFSDRECALLDLVGEHLTRQYERLRVAGQQRSELDATARLLLGEVGPGAEAGFPGAVQVVLPQAALVSLSLTPREREVLRWVAAGKTDRDIALLLGCSHRTVQKHLERTYPKLGVETRTAAVMRALHLALQ